MPNPVKIFVEGVADIKFLADYIKHIAPAFDIVKETIINCGGCTNIYSQNEKREDILNQMKQNTSNAGVNLVIFDADADFETRKTEIENWKTQHVLNFEIFLFPNNNDAGALENLLEKIILEKNQPIFDCWNGYERCLQSKTIDGRAAPLTTPAKKTKIYGYLEALLGTTKKEKEKIKEKERDYNNKEHWNLDSDYLNPLKDFLLLNLQ
jgi:hypothetical protein